MKTSFSLNTEWNIIKRLFPKEIFPFPIRDVSYYLWLFHSDKHNTKVLNYYYNQ